MQKHVRRFRDIEESFPITDIILSFVQASISEKDSTA